MASFHRPNSRNSYVLLLSFIKVFCGQEMAQSQLECFGFYAIAMKLVQGLISKFYGIWFQLDCKQDSI